MTIDAGTSQSNPDRSSYEVVSVSPSSGTGIVTVTVNALITSSTLFTSVGYDIGFTEKG